MIQKRKVLELSIEYNDHSNMIRSFREILKELSKHRTNFQRFTKAECFAEWSISSLDFKDHRIEKINGDVCMILESKMNKQ